LLPLRIPESGHRLVTLPNGPRIIEASVELQSLSIEHPGPFAVSFVLGQATSNPETVGKSPTHAGPPKQRQRFFEIA